MSLHRNSKRKRVNGADDDDFKPLPAVLLDLQKRQKAALAEEEAERQLRELSWTDDEEEKVARLAGKSRVGDGEEEEDVDMGSDRESGSSTATMYSDDDDAEGEDVCAKRRQRARSSRGAKVVETPDVVTAIQKRFPGPPATDVKSALLQLAFYGTGTVLNSTLKLLAGAPKQQIWKALKDREAFPAFRNEEMAAKGLNEAVKPDETLSGDKLSMRLHDPTAVIAVLEGFRVLAPYLEYDEAGVMMMAVARIGADCDVMLDGPVLRLWVDVFEYYWAILEMKGWDETLHTLTHQITTKLLHPIHQTNFLRAIPNTTKALRQFRRRLALAFLFGSLEEKPTSQAREPTTRDYLRVLSPPHFNPRSIPPPPPGRPRSRPKHLYAVAYQVFTALQGGAVAPSPEEQIASAATTATKPPPPTSTWRGAPSGQQALRCEQKPKPAPPERSRHRPRLGIPELDMVLVSLEALCNGGNADELDDEMEARDMWHSIKRLATRNEGPIHLVLMD